MFAKSLETSFFQLLRLYHPKSNPDSVGVKILFILTYLVFICFDIVLMNSDVLVPIGSDLFVMGSESMKSFVLNSSFWFTAESKGYKLNIFKDLIDRVNVGHNLYFKYSNDL